MDEEEYERYQRVIFGLESMAKDYGVIYEQIWDEDGSVPGCYRKLPTAFEPE